LPVKVSLLFLALLTCAGWCQADELAGAATIAVREIRVENNELIPQSILDAMLPAYRNRQVSAAELQELAQRLTAYLVEQGYVSSGVIVPDQKVSDGIIHLRVMPGRVASTAITGKHRLRERYIVGRLGDIYSAPLNVNALAERLQLLERDPRIEKINAAVKPGLGRGAAALNLEIEETTPYGFSVGADNHISPNVGGERLRAELYHLNLTGLGDALQLSYNDAEGYSGGTATYTMPVTRWNTTVSVLFERSSSRIVTEPFESLDIEGDTTRYAAELRHPLIRNLQTELTLGIGVEKQEVESFLLGEPFSFSASDVNGVSETTVVSLTQEWARYQAARVIAARSTFYLNEDFTYWLGQAQWLQKLMWLDSTLGVNAQVRLSNATLPAYRKYALGGAESVRGYRENLVVRDNGALFSVQWSVPIPQIPLPGELRVTPFVDYGYGRDYEDDLSEPLDIAAVGVGIQWQFARHANVELQFAHALIDQPIASIDRVLQDDGVHFSARIGW
jgi:hemolysin activation/secretion protein